MHGQKSVDTRILHSWFINMSLINSLPSSGFTLSSTGSLLQFTFTLVLVYRAAKGTVHPTTLHSGPALLCLGTVGCPVAQRTLQSLISVGGSFLFWPHSGGVNAPLKSLHIFHCRLKITLQVAPRHDQKKALPVLDYM